MTVDMRPSLFIESSSEMKGEAAGYGLVVFRGPIGRDRFGTRESVNFFGTREELRRFALAIMNACEEPSDTQIDGTKGYVMGAAIENPPVASLPAEGDYF